jgi:transcriptional regulator with XRE-family HTH domain
MTVNERIKVLRQALDMTQAQFGEAICLSNGYIADLENAHRQANGRIIHLIALNFGVSEEWLKTGAGEMFIHSPEEKARRIMAIFDELKPEFQDFALKQLDLLLELQKNDVRKAGSQVGTGSNDGQQGIDKRSKMQYIG